MSFSFSVSLVVFAEIILSSAALRAEVRLPALISDNMVLQRDVAVPIWGDAKPGETITITFAGQKKVAQADPLGKWITRLDPLKTNAGGELTVTGENTITIRNVLVGETWLASGQSNMAMQTAQVDNSRQEIAAADHPKIRLFTVATRSINEPQSDVTGHWVECSPQTVGNFSAVAYFFGRDLQSALGDCPVGLINSSVGGTWIQAWISRPALEGHPKFKAGVAWADKMIAEYPAALEKYAADLAGWQQATDKARTEGTPLPPKPPSPRNPEDPNHAPNRPAGAYNGMIAPLMPYAIRGVIWYQGEANAFTNSGYDILFPMLIDTWRKRWGQGDFPFLFVQLPNYQSTQKFVEIREAQLKTLAVPATGMAVTIDVGNSNDIHPRNKQVVGHRLALTALGIAYGQNVEYCGPSFQSMKIDGRNAVVRFSHAAGLKAKHVGQADANSAGFVVAGEDRIFVPAEGKIQGDTITVWSEKVDKPVAVRYGWEVDPKVDLYNQEDLPASPFRTDDWLLQ